MKISQREARRLRKRVEELEQLEDGRLKAWKSEYPGGVFLTGISVQPAVHAMAKTARKLGHAVVVTTNGDTELHFYALRLPRS